MLIGLHLHMYKLAKILHFSLTHSAKLKNYHIPKKDAQ